MMLKRNSWALRGIEDSETALGGCNGSIHRRRHPVKDSGTQGLLRRFAFIAGATLDPPFAFLIETSSRYLFRLPLYLDQYFLGESDR